VTWCARAPDVALAAQGADAQASACVVRDALDELGGAARDADAARDAVRDVRTPRQKVA